MPKVNVKVEFTTNATNRFLSHSHGKITLDAQGKGSFKVEAGDWDVLLCGVRGPSGSTAKITLGVDVPYQLVISGHPIHGQVAQGKQVWGTSRFFRVLKKGD